MNTYTLSGSLPESGSVNLKMSGSDFTLRAQNTVEDIDFDITIEVFRQALKRKSKKTRIEVEHTYFGDNTIPALRCHPAGGKNLPVVIFIHGFNGNKALDTGRGIQLAERGIHAIVLDARLHGERRPDDFDKKFRPDRWVNSFFGVLKGTVRDISTVIDELSQDERVDCQRVGVAGISMGGFTTFLAAIRERRLKAAVPMIGSPDILMLAERERFPPVSAKLRASLIRASAIEQNNKIGNCALLVQNGAKDTVVSVTGARKLDRIMKKRQKTEGLTYRYIEYPDVGHEVSDEMMEETIAWFEAYL